MKQAVQASETCLVQVAEVQGLKDPQNGQGVDSQT